MPGTNPSLKNNLNDYVHNTALIRSMSAPTLTGIESAEQYSEHLRDSFIRIGEIAQKNREILERSLYPYFRNERQITEDEMDSLGSFADSLLDAYSLDNLDPAILSVLSEELLTRADDIDSDRLLIEQLDREIMACYTLMNITNRLFGCGEVAESYRQRGFRAGRKLLRYLSPEILKSLPDDDTRALVLINARYMWVLYEGSVLTEEEGRKNLENLERILHLAEEPAYREAFPDYNWKNHVFRTMHYMAIAEQDHNARGLPEDVLKRICRRVEEMDALYHADPYYRTLIEEKEMELLLLRAHYECGEITREEYREKLKSLYDRRDPSDYELSGMNLNLNIPVEYMLTLDRNRISEKDSERLTMFYRDVIRYAFHLPENGSISYLLEYISAVFREYIEIPGAPTFEEMYLNCLAALHPPTYVHSIMVAEITRCLLDHLWEKDPGLFAAIPEGHDRKALRSFAWHAAVCHDAGKILMIDTILIYGRELLKEEMSLIRCHPVVGSGLLARQRSTARYRNVALLHHRWFDGQNGYPSDRELREKGLMDMDPSGNPDQAVIDIVTVADCLDAATDRVGRSYQKGKTLEEFIEELGDGRGTRYAPFVVDLFDDERVRKDIDHILSGDREKNYRRSFLLLKTLRDAE